MQPVAGLPPPDLKAPHTAIGLHFKAFPNNENVWHNALEHWYSLRDVQTHVSIYDDRVRGWFLECARQRLEHDGILVLMITTGYFEGHEQYRRGEASNNNSGAFFKATFDRLFPDLATRVTGSRWSKKTKKDEAIFVGDTFYTEVRCGLFHDGMTRSRVGISNHDVRDAVIWSTDEDGRLLINPNMLLARVIEDHDSYVAELRTNEALRGRFVRVWRERSRRLTETLEPQPGEAES